MTIINYYLLTKPGILLGNLVTTAAGFLLASKGIIDFWLFFTVLMGLTCIMASGCVFNNYIDRTLDKKMERTKNRALVIGLISGRNALFFALILGILGNLILYVYTNYLTVFIADIGLFVYAVLYSLWKSRTIYGTAIGSIAGAIPPIVGYCAVSNHFDMGALIFFTMMTFWQMPHFFSIALLHFKDYTAAGIPVLPIEKGILVTKIHMVIYISSFILAAVMLTLFKYTGYWYLVIVTTLGFSWLLLCIKGFSSKDDQAWGRHMFRLSLILINATCFTIPFDTL